MRIGDILVILTEPKEFEDKFFGKFYAALVKPLRAKFNNAVNVQLFFPDGMIPEKQEFPKGVQTKIDTMNPNAIWRIADIDIAGQVHENKPRTHIRVYCMPNERDFLGKYIQTALEKPDDEPFDWGRMKKELDGTFKYNPFIFYKFIKYIYRHRKTMPAWKEVAALEEVVTDLLRENDKKDKEIERLTQLSLVASQIDIFTKGGKVKQRYLKDLK